MRVLFLLSGKIWPHTLPEGFREACHETLVIPADSSEQVSGVIARYRPHLAVSIGWGREQHKTKQPIIRNCLQAARVPHVYWSVEDPEYTLRFSVPLLQSVQPDFVFTICRESVGYFQGLGFKAAYLDFGFSPAVHRSMDRGRVHNIAVVANAYPWIWSKRPDHFRCRALSVLIEPLLRRRTRVDFWGRGWEELASVCKWEIPPEWLHGPADYRDTAEIYNSAAITLGLQNYTDQVTQRTYEVLGSGGFLLTVDTPGVRALFSPGEDLVCSCSPWQTVELVRYYQARPELRRGIAAHGQHSAGAHTYRHRAEYMLEVLRQAGIVGGG